MQNGNGFCFSFIHYSLSLMHLLVLLTKKLKWDKFEKSFDHIPINALTTELVGFGAIAHITCTHTCADWKERKNGSSDALKYHAERTISQSRFVCHFLLAANFL